MKKIIGAMQAALGIRRDTCTSDLYWKWMHYHNI